jgi:methylated-DNA-[protein]-cysteine S-methyltransferase
LRICADAAGLTAIDVIDEPPMTVAPLTLPHLKEAYRQLNEYFRGERLSFNLPLNPKGSDVQRSLWQVLSGIPFGTTISVQELEGRIGGPAGLAAGGELDLCNPLPIVVPCHRVIGDDGDPVGYAFGSDVKRKLLRMEGAEIA